MERLGSLEKVVIVVGELLERVECLEERVECLEKDMNRASDDIIMESNISTHMREKSKQEIENVNKKFESHVAWCSCTMPELREERRERDSEGSAS